jgi:hypothetical protein
MIRRILRVTGIELFKLRRRRGAWALLALLLLVVLGQAVSTATEAGAQRDRTRELNAWVVFADAAGTGLFVAALLLALQASVAFAGETTLGTLKGLLVRPVTRAELVLGKLAALLVVAAALAAVVLGAAAGAGAALGDYEGVKTVAHNERETGLLAEDHPEKPGAAATGRADLRRLGLAGHWDNGLAALRVERVVPGSLAEARQIQAGDVVTHAATGDAAPARLASLDGWLRWAATLQEGDAVRLRVDSPVVAPNRDFTGAYIAGQAGRALLMVPLPLVAVVCFGLAWSALVEGAGTAVGGTLLSFLALRYVAAPVAVSLARLTGATDVFVADTERYLFTTWLAAPLVRLHGAATATSNLEIRDAHLAWSAAVCAATAALGLAVALWRVRRRDVL